MRKAILASLIIVGGILGLTVYFLVDPSKTFMPRCPFYELTGWLCPGCGSQRAIHALLHFNFSQAFKFNPLLVIALPYIALGCLLFLLDKRGENVLWLRTHLFGRWAAYIWVIVIILYWILRNL